MKIGFILPSLANEAPIMIAISLANNLSLRGHDVTIFYFSGNKEIKVLENVSIQKISFIDKIEFNYFDVVHSHLFRPDFYVFLHSIFNKANCVFISTIHNYVYPELKNYYNIYVAAVFGRLWNLAWTKFDCLAVLSKHAKGYYNDVSYNKSIECLYNGRDIIIEDVCDDEIDSLHKFLKSKGMTVIGTYCNLIKRKNVSLLIKYASRIENSCLFIIGQGPEMNSLKCEVGKLGLTDRVYFFGYRPNAHMYNKYFDIYAIPSIDEGFGLALIEAALHRKKIVCSDIPVFREIFDEKCVSFFSPSSVDSLVHAVDNVKAKIGCEDLAFQRAISEFSELSMLERYITLYRRLISLKKNNAAPTCDA